MSNDAVQHFEDQPIRSACNPDKEEWCRHTAAKIKAEEYSKARRFANAGPFIS